MICKLVYLKNNYNKIQSQNNNHKKKQKNLIVNVILFVKRNLKFYIVLIMIFRKKMKGRDEATISPSNYLVSILFYYSRKNLFLFF